MITGKEFCKGRVKNIKTKINIAYLKIKTPKKLLYEMFVAHKLAEACIFVDFYEFMDPYLLFDYKRCIQHPLNEHHNPLIQCDLFISKCLQEYENTGNTNIFIDIAECLFSLSQMQFEDKILIDYYCH